MKFSGIRAAHYQGGPDVGLGALHSARLPKTGSDRLAGLPGAMASHHDAAAMSEDKQAEELLSESGSEDSDAAEGSEEEVSAACRLLHCPIIVKPLVSQGRSLPLGAAQRRRAAT